ncbi:MAG: phage protein NinX family protein [Gallionellaceae bacterium]|jgi:hypothetical protein
MEKIKVSELEGDALHWAKAKAEGVAFLTDSKRSTDWADIAEQEDIGVHPAYSSGWQATYEKDSNLISTWGETPFKALARCFIAKKLGFVIEIPATYINN